MNAYPDRYARFGVIVGILVGVAIIAIAGLFFPRPDTDDTAYTNYPVVVSMNTSGLSENGYIGWGNENTDWRDQFINFSRDDIQVTGQVRDDYIEIFLRDTSTGVMARIAGDNVSSRLLNNRMYVQNVSIKKLKGEPPPYMMAHKKGKLIRLD